jgi:two-component system cell cycle sensor histidine kinase/response regulator CckA
VGLAQLDPEHVLTIATDLTPLRSAQQAKLAVEEQLRQAQKMEAVGRLAGGVAHDFNNILSVILGYAQMAAEDLAEDDPVGESVAQIMGAAERATRQLLLFSRQQVVEPVVLALDEVVSGLETMLRRTLGEDIRLSVLSGPGLGRVRADRGSIEQVVMNLVVNARDAMPGGGSIRIRLENVEVDGDVVRHVGASPGSHLLLEVRDDGSGMDAATRARLFEPFFTTKGRGKGTGLGLSTVLGIVAQSGGSVRVDSEPGAGATFQVLLPRVDAELGSIRPPPRSRSRGHETVLLLDDEPAVRDVARDILRRSGFQVLEAVHASAALEICRSHPGPIDLLVTDVVMPDVAGPSLARRLLALRPSMRVLLMSGYSDDEKLCRGVEDVPFPYLQKPLTVAALTQRVREVLDGEMGAPGAT